MAQVLIDLARALGIEAVAILLSMFTDLVVGVRKARQRGEARTSYGLSRTATKLLTYYGAFGVGACIDVLLHVGHLWVLFGIDTLNHVPVVATIIAIFLCIVELLSIQESADSKTKKRLATTADTLAKFASKSELVDALAKAITLAQEAEKSKKQE